MPARKKRKNMITCSHPDCRGSIGLNSDQVIQLRLRARLDINRCPHCKRGFSYSAVSSRPVSRRAVPTEDSLGLAPQQYADERTGPGQPHHHWPGADEVEVVPVVDSGEDIPVVPVASSDSDPPGFPASADEWPLQLPVEPAQFQRRYKVQQSTAQSAPPVAEPPAARQHRPAKWWQRYKTLPEWLQVIAVIAAGGILALIAGLIWSLLF